MYEVSDFRNGLKILYEGEPYIIVEFQHVKPGKGNAFTRTKLKNLLTGRTLEPTFKSGEKFGVPDIEEKEMQYLFREGNHLTFMDNQSFEQVLVDADAIGEDAKYLKENDNAQVLFYNGKGVGVTTATFIIAKVIECEPGVRGDTATNVTKPAKIETGAIVKVPLFVNEGDVIKVDTRSGEYSSRA
jgi:elongation factor P